MLKGPDGKCVVCGVDVSNDLWCDPCWAERKSKVLATEAKRVPKVSQDAKTAKKVKGSLGPVSLKGPNAS